MAANVETINVTAAGLGSAHNTLDGTNADSITVNTSAFAAATGTTRPAAPNCTGRTVTNGIQNGHLTMFVGASSYPGNVQLVPGGTDLYLIHASSPQANASPTVPGTWANGDRFVITAEFEVDP